MLSAHPHVVFCSCDTTRISHALSMPEASISVAVKFFLHEPPVIASLSSSSSLYGNHHSCEKTDDSISDTNGTMSLVSPFPLLTHLLPLATKNVSPPSSPVKFYTKTLISPHLGLTDRSKHDITSVAHKRYFI